MGVPAEQPGSDAADLTKDLFDEYSRRVFVLCRTLLRDHAEAEDAAQQTFLAAHRSILAGHRPRHPAAWLATIARNECRARWARRQERLSPLPDVEAPDLDPAEIAAVHEDLAVLGSALAHLPRRQRDVIRLHCLAGLSYGEVAQTLAISSRAVDGLLLRARKRLRRRIRGLRAGILVLPGVLRDRLAQLSGVEEAGGAAAVTAGGATGAFSAAGSTSLTAKLAVVGVGIATLGTSADQAPELRRHLAHQRAHQAQQAAPARRGGSLMRVVPATPRPEHKRSAGHDDERGKSSGEGDRGHESGSGAGSSTGPDGGGSSGSESAGSGRSGSGRSGSGSSGPGSSAPDSGSRSSASSSSGSGSFDSRSSGSGSGSGSSGSGGSGSWSSGSGSTDSGSSESEDSRSGSSGSGSGSG